jgi:hypothetical protein
VREIGLCLMLQLNKYELFYRKSGVFLDNQKNYTFLYHLGVADQMVKIV